MIRNESLHAAIDNQDIETFLDLLRQPGVDLNYKNEKGHTPLTASIRKCNIVMLKYLIEAGCDVNLPEADSNASLHVTLGQEKVDLNILRILIQEGANINVQNFIESTPLHQAVLHNNLEATSLLLYYGADASIVDYSKWDPLETAVNYDRNCQQTLLNYYDDFSNKDYCEDTVMHKATRRESSILYDLIERGADVNCLDNCNRCLLHETSHNNNAKMFKFIWARIDHGLLEKSNYNSPFVLAYLYQRSFSTSDFFECLYLMFESPIVQKLIAHYVNYVELIQPRDSFVYALLKMFAEREVLPKDRLSIIYTCLSFGIKVQLGDLRSAHRYYGMGEEFKALLFVGNFSCNDCMYVIRHWKKLKEGFYLKGFSSFSQQYAKELEAKYLKISLLRHEKLLKALENVPKFPSLLELARNEAQKCIQQNYHINKLHQFYDAVASLKLPPSMKDVLLLEKPIYNYSESEPEKPDSSDEEDFCNFDDGTWDPDSTFYFDE